MPQLRRTFSSFFSLTGPQRAAAATSPRSPGNCKRKRSRATFFMDVFHATALLTLFCQMGAGAAGSADGSTTTGRRASPLSRRHAPNLRGDFEGPSGLPPTYYTGHLAAQTPRHRTMLDVQFRPGDVR